MKEHGTASRYKHGACRCAPCRAAHSENMREMGRRAKARPYDFAAVAGSFWELVEFDGCWSWLGAKTVDGYGKFNRNCVSMLAHRWAYAFCIGPIPHRLTIDHLCRNRGCVNPDHLEAVSDRVNILRGTSPAAINAVLTACRRGHPFDDANTRIDRVPGTTRVGRRCLACARLRRKNRKSLSGGGNTEKGS